MNDRPSIPFESRMMDLIREIGEPVEMFYEPRNEGHEWYVGLANSHGHDLPLHDHFPTVEEGLTWLLLAKRALGDD